jgi:kynurenine formamidase
MIVDLSLPLTNRIQSEKIRPRIRHVNHKKGACVLGLEWLTIGSRCERLRKIFSYIVGSERLVRKDFPDEMGLAFDVVRTSTHCGTHVDAPLHFGPFSENKKSESIDELPLEWFYGNGVLIDVRYKGAGELISVEDIESSLRNVDYEIKPYDIVLIWTGSDKLWGGKEYVHKYPGMSREATEWLIDRGVKVIGIDAWGFDKPPSLMLKDYFKTRDKRCLYPSHFLGRERKYCHIEKMANFDKITRPFGFKVICFPIKIQGGTAAWVRAVAII